MRFIIADTFMRSLAPLEREEQGLVKQAAFEFQAQPDSPGFSFHKLERARDPRFWSFRVNRDLRIIIHRPIDRAMYLPEAGPARRKAIVVDRVRVKKAAVRPDEPIEVRYAMGFQGLLDQ
jgi:hypothetical protein